jgi:hypothetical protein
MILVYGHAMVISLIVSRDVGQTINKKISGAFLLR